MILKFLCVSVNQSKYCISRTANQMLFLQPHFKKRNWRCADKGFLFIVWLLDIYVVIGGHFEKVPQTVKQHKVWDYVCSNWGSEINYKICCKFLWFWDIILWCSRSEIWLQFYPITFPYCNRKGGLQGSCLKPYVSQLPSFFWPQIFCL